MASTAAVQIEAITNRSLDIARTGVINLTTISSPTGASPGVTTYTHNLGYVPAVIAYIDDGSHGLPLTYTLYNLVTGALRNRVYVQADRTTVSFIFQAWTSESVQVLPIRFYLLQDVSK